MGHGISDQWTRRSESFSIGLGKYKRKKSGRRNKKMCTSSVQRTSTAAGALAENSIRGGVTGRGTGRRNEKRKKRPAKRPGMELTYAAGWLTQSLLL